MAIDKKTLVNKLHEIANEIDENDHDLKSAKCALFVICGVIDSDLPEHINLFHNLVWNFAGHMRKDLERRLLEQKELTNKLMH